MVDVTSTAVHASTASARMRWASRSYSPPLRHGVPVRSPFGLGVRSHSINRAGSSVGRGSRLTPSRSREIVPAPPVTTSTPTAVDGQAFRSGRWRIRPRRRGGLVARTDVVPSPRRGPNSLRRPADPIIGGLGLGQHHPAETGPTGPDYPKSVQHAGDTELVVHHRGRFGEEGPRLSRCRNLPLGWVSRSAESSCVVGMLLVHGTTFQSSGSSLKTASKPYSSWHVAPTSTGSYRLVPLVTSAPNGQQPAGAVGFRRMRTGNSATAASPRNSGARLSSYRRPHLDRTSRSELSGLRLRQHHQHSTGPAGQDRLQI